MENQYRIVPEHLVLLSTMTPSLRSLNFDLLRNNCLNIDVISGPLISQIDWLKIYHWFRIQSFRSLVKVTNTINVK